MNITGPPQTELNMLHKIKLDSLVNLHAKKYIARVGGWGWAVKFENRIPRLSNTIWVKVSSFSRMIFFFSRIVFVKNASTKYGRKYKQNIGKERKLYNIIVLQVETELNSNVNQIWLTA